MSNERDYPLPASALSIWLTGDKLHIGMTGITLQDGSVSGGHTLTLPLDNLGFALTESGTVSARGAGWKILLDLLKERERVGRSTIGTKSEPVQYDLEQMLKGMKSYDAKGKEKVTEEDLGL